MLEVRSVDSCHKYESLLDLYREIFRFGVGPPLRISSMLLSFTFPIALYLISIITNSPLFKFLACLIKRYGSDVLRAGLPAMSPL
jgi:hypothetical protein